MSVEAISWALNLAPVPADHGGRPSSTCKFVLVGLANHAGPDGAGAFPSVATLVRLSERTVRTCLDRLEAEGIIAPGDPDVVAMLGWLRQTVGYDAARALAYDPEAMLPVAFASGDERRWDEEAAACWMAFAEADAAQFALLSTSGAKVALRTAEPAAAPGPGWAALLAPGRWRHELRAAVADGNGRCWCSLAAFRGGGRPFGGAHAAAVARAVPGFAARLSHAIAAGPAPQLPGHPASLWLSDRGQLLVTTAGGRDWLSQLQTPGMPGRAGAVLAGLTARVQAGPGPDQVAPACVRLRGSRGEWLTMQGERLTGTDGRTHGISVIVGSARPATVLPLLAAAYGLTPREREVISGVLGGLSTRQISVRLQISGYTVQDHLKVVFAELGVTSRGELAHRLDKSRQQLPRGGPIRLAGPCGPG